ncbi:unnamed protein product [Knipowitschia caucasica]
MPVRKKDALRALGLLEEYCTKLTKPEEEQLKTAIQRVMGIFNSNLFEALLDIQEFYEVTLLNTQKSREQKLEEVNHMAEHWVRSTSAHDSEPTPAACLLEKEQSGSEPSGMERPVSSAKTAEVSAPVVPLVMSFIKYPFITIRSPHDPYHLTVLPTSVHRPVTLH